MKDYILLIKNFVFQNQGLLIQKKNIYFLKSTDNKLKRCQASCRAGCGTSQMIETPNRLRKSTTAEASQVVLVVKNLPASVGGIRVVCSIPGSGMCLEEGMATCSSILAWRIPWTEEPGGLQSIGLQRVGHSWSNSAKTHAHCSRRSRVASHNSSGTVVPSPRKSSWIGIKAWCI